MQSTFNIASLMPALQALFAQVPAGGPGGPTVSPLGPQVQPLPWAPGPQGAPPPGAWLETLSAALPGLRSMVPPGLQPPGGGGMQPMTGGGFMAPGNLGGDMIPAWPPQGGMQAQTGGPFMAPPGGMRPATGGPFTPPPAPQGRWRGPNKGRGPFSPMGPGFMPPESPMAPQPPIMAGPRVDPYGRGRRGPFGGG